MQAYDDAEIMAMKKFGDHWYKPVYYWDAWDKTDFIEPGCIEAQRKRTGIFAWRSVDEKHAIVEKDGQIIRNTPFEMLYARIS